MTASPLQGRRMPRVLIPSDNLDFALYLADAYRQAGWDVVMGSANFDLGGAEFNLVHFQWPEELTGWNEPPEARLAEVSARLDAWRQRTKLVLTVHNLRPHRNGDSVGFRKLYEAFYQRVHVIAHFTETSRDAVTKEFPASGDVQHIVTGYFNLDRLLPSERDLNGARRELGFAEDAFVVLIIGSLREWAEVELIKRGLDAASVPEKRLLMSGRYDEAGPRLRQRWRRWTWSRWLRSRNAVVRGFLPDPEVHRIIDPADAVLIPRFRAMNSGLPALGASFGKIIIAPRCGAYPELLNGTQHPIYEAGDAASLARALENASRLNRAAVTAECRRLVDSWQWPAMIRAIVDAV
jgi:glycosyltransferase involved in cell wall biosynthesis